ncbi:TonB-dependent receptor domain-containing protein [Horticoccus sp. 23ND18S-11]|uniref:TonB-dependent receptor domain-containing protein n=1 Tax=Horticoccus sp. 23ND18S-11 TaxID=3391832 RepID=UPI0039C99542
MIKKLPFTAAACRLLTAVTVCSLASLSTPPLVAQTAPAAVGVVQGRVFNPATGEYVRNAEIRLQGTQRIAYSEEGGVYQLDNVPAGNATLQVTFSGYQTATATVAVTPGAAATRDFELVSALAPGRAGGDEVLKLGAFVVSTDREGNAKAIMEQRRNMNISTSVAADSFGDVTEGNVGEFLKFLPGVDVEYVDGISRGPRVGGLDQQYVGVTMDGASVASADAFASYGSTLNGSAGSQSRSVGFEQMSITAVESIEISRTLSADMDANSPAGSINMKSRRAFDRKGRRVDWQFSVGFNTPDAAKFERVRGWDDNLRRQWRPNYQLDYSDVFLNQRLGVRLSLSSSSIRSEQQYVTNNYNKTQVTTGAAPDLRPMVLTSVVFTDGPRLSSRANATGTIDFKASSRLVLSLTAMFNAFENNAHTKSLTFNAAANGVAAATGRQNVLGDGLTEIRTNGLAANTSRTFAHGGGSAIKLTNSVVLTPKFEYKAGALTVDGTGNFSRSKNDYETSSRGTIRAETLNTIPVDFVATRSSAQSAEWTIVQTGGADWSNLANFTNPRITEEGRFAYTEILSGEINARYVTPWRLPTFFKFGGKWAEENRETDNTTPYLLYSYVGPGGNILNPNGTVTAAGSFAAFPSPRAFNTDMGRIRALTISNLPTLANRSDLSQLYREHPEYFVNTATPENYYSGYIANRRDFGQKVTASYGMANTRIGRVQIQGGLRWERTETMAKEFDPLTAAQVQAAGFPVSATTRRATTIPGLQYQYFSQPRVTRKGEYDNFFPSVSAKYSFTPSLQVQAGYSHAIARPPIDALGGVWSINDIAKIITAPNANLKPEVSDNYVARLAYYFEPVGSFTFLVQQIEISDQRITRRATAEQFGYGDDPEYADYEFETQLNNSTLYRYRSAELGYSRQLTFLPGVLRNTNLNLSYTRNYANQYFPGVSPHKGTASLGWSYKRLSLRVGGVWQDDTPFTTVFGRYQRHNIKLDLSGGVKVTSRVSMFFQGRNILNDPTLLYEGDPTRGIPAALYRYGNFGVSWSLGVRGNF